MTNATPAAGPWLEDLLLLCASPTISGDARALETGLASVVELLQRSRLSCHIYATAGMPVVLGRYDAGRSRTILIYGRFDVPSPGPRRAWRADPFQPVVRGDRLWSRGAVVKAELVARVHALRRLIDMSALPCNVLFVIEAESTVGSPHIADLAPAVSRADRVVWSGGTTRHDGVPLLYTGVKGLLQVDLHAEGARIPLPSSYAGVAPNPLWQLVSALASVKSAWEEVTIEGFYDAVVPPSDDALSRVRDLDLGEAARRSAWGVDNFVADLRGPLLARVESFSPSANLSAITFDGDNAALPHRAAASLQFQLVPDQRPDAIFDLLCKHLAAAGMTSIRAQRSQGGYPPHAGFDLPFVSAAADAIRAIYGSSPHTLDLAPFSGPASLLVPPGTPLVSCGLERADSALYGPDESVAVPDLSSHINLLVELIGAVGSV